MTPCGVAGYQRFWGPSCFTLQGEDSNSLWSHR